MTFRPLEVSRRWLRSALCCLCLGGVVTLADLARATVMVDLPLDDLILRADLVVRGRVVRTGIRVRAQQDPAAPLQPRTHVWIEVQEVLAGQVPEGGVVHLWEPGGRYGGVQTTVAGTPHYERDENVLVFLTQDREQPGLYRTLEMVQGKFHILPHVAGSERQAVRDMSDVAIARWRRRRMEVGPPSQDKPMSLPTLTARVRALRLAPESHKEVSR